MDRAKFFAPVRSSLFSGSLSQKQVDGTDALLDESEKRNVPLKHVAYVLATAYHETAHTMQPIAEYGKGKSRPYGAPGKHGQAQYGRGYVQLTWDANYERADKELGLNGALLKDFDLALKPDIAAAILFSGMAEGWFTGKKLSDYISDAKADYVGARRIVNGTDKAEMIAGYARSFEGALTDAGYGTAAAPKPEPVPALVERAPVDGGNWIAALLSVLLAAFGRKA